MMITTTTSDYERFGFFFRFQKTTTTNRLRCVTIIYDVLLTIPAHAPTVINETNRRGNDHLLPRNRCLNFDTRGSLKLRQRRRRPVDISICTKFLCSYAMYWHSTQNILYYPILWCLYECNTYRNINKRYSSTYITSKTLSGKKNEQT